MVREIQAAGRGGGTPRDGRLGSLGQRDGLGRGDCVRT